MYRKKVLRIRCLSTHRAGKRTAANHTFQRSRDQPAMRIWLILLLFLCIFQTHWSFPPLLSHIPCRCLFVGIRKHTEPFKQKKGAEESLPHPFSYLIRLIQQGVHNIFHAANSNVNFRHQIFRRQHFCILVRNLLV